MEIHGPLFVTSPFPPRGEPVIKMLKVPNCTPIEFVVISTGPMWIKTHWVNYRTVRCVPGKCQHCEDEVSGRWRGFLAVAVGRGNPQKILEFSRDAFEPLEGLYAKAGTLRAAVIEVKREHNHEKSALLMRYITEGTVSDKIKPVEIQPTLLRMWSAKNRRSRRDVPPVE